MSTGAKTDPRSDPKSDPVTPPAGRKTPWSNPHLVPPLAGIAVLLLMQAALLLWPTIYGKPLGPEMRYLQIALWLLSILLLAWLAFVLRDLSILLSGRLDESVKDHVEHIAMKSRTLEVLYDVAASINMATDLDDLLNRFLHTMKDVVSARAACVRLLDDQGQMQLVASIGLEDVLHVPAQALALDACLDGTVLCSADEEESLQGLSHHGTGAVSPGNGIETVIVPLVYRGTTLGVYTLYVDRPEVTAREDIRNLLISIGRHLGMAIEKAQLDEEARNMTIMQERATLAHELHDSLAQTLASLRFQVRVLDETLQQSSEYGAISEIEQVENSLDEAYSELRDLIAHFRAPMGGHSLMPAVENLVKRFRAQCSIPIFLQYGDWRNDKLAAHVEMNILRIIQEALTNIRKHSQASNVRVMLRHEKDASSLVLIEDDGIGISRPTDDTQPGEHIGLLIMQERARRIGGELRIESEPGEGTRIVLTFRPETQEKRKILPMLRAT
jgi:two-component system nitrate/nitrite sensor histidine kinase NarX